LICHVNVIYIRLFEVNCIDFSFVSCSFVIAFLVIYFHNYFLRVFCYLGGLFFLHLFNCLIFFIPCCYIWCFSEFFLVGIFGIFLINIYYILCCLCLYSTILCCLCLYCAILCYLCLYCAILCSKWATVNLYFTKKIQVRNR
jgi:hypothetical protein